MDLISIIILISIIAKIFKKNSPQKYEETVRKAKELGGEVVGELRGNVESKRMMAEQQKKKYEQKLNRQATTQRSTYEMPRQTVENDTVMEENDYARQQVYKSRMEAKNTSILERAKANAQEDAEDVTLRSLEESHGHSAHVAPAVHHHPEDVMDENVLGKVEDLMAKGYEGNLCFERDFVGEGMDMVARFSLGGSVANES